MNTVTGISEGFDKPLVRRVSTVAISEFSDAQSLMLLSPSAEEVFDSLLTNITRTESFKFSSKALKINDGDLLYIEPAAIATRIYDATSTMNSLFLTEECNCRCLSCPQPPVKADALPWIDIALQSIRLIKTAPECIGITGGEPTLKWNGLLQVLDACAEHLPETSIQLLSNGRVFANYQKARELSKHHEKMFLGIPLHADCDEVHDKLAGRRGAFWETVSAIHNLERARLSVELRIVVSKANFERLPQLSEFIYKNFPFVQHVAFMAIEPVGKAKQNAERLWIDPVDYQTQLIEAVRRLWRRGIQPLIFNHQFCTLNEALWPITIKTITEWKVRYDEECGECIKKDQCGGFFYSTIRSRGTKGIAK